MPCFTSHLCYVLIQLGKASSQPHPSNLQYGDMKIDLLYSVVVRTINILSMKHIKYSNALVATMYYYFYY